ncbi:uncharacterized protein B0I36DRAFT_335384 [Microdochium trichocladiopsis]|uniref:2-oxoadipate dioxygenase/decarboxylase n=1 Tax=Microdochium trichocladiopsis TaxID=1682393 RepID=A0A9P8XU31_9PEZI|nr:uncharacterized protein B0I36DRAFT_335384 [Microdochium trichocladiopsis]KAH7018144.1 hypothetical protein B0I36DRAFT_335384 [Microdochium trichocladiopsis]
MSSSANTTSSSAATQVVDSSKPAAGSMAQYVDADDLRTMFSQAMSAMYRAEVPLYGDLIRIVNETNTAVLATSADAKIEALRRHGNVAAERLDLERHGAIRLGKPDELHTVRRLFRIIGLDPVGYYDLSVAGLPMHATAFRPTDPAALKKNPFRVFTTLLRPELLVDADARDLALSLLARRNIFTRQLMQLIAAAESPAQGGRLTTEQAPLFIAEAMKTFSWRAAAVATEAEYLQLKAEHPILADIACFQSSHINHLTPRTLDIEVAQDRMLDDGLAIKDRIEGPPRRNCPILLRQTSFLALEEKIKFPQSLGGSSVPAAVDEETLLDDSQHPEDDDAADPASYKIGTHKARFGEIEERGAAVTPLGRKLYDRLLHESSLAAASAGHPASSQRQHNRRMDEASERIFGASYPDSWDALRKQGLVYFTYTPTTTTTTTPAVQATGTPSGGETVTIESLLTQGLIEATPLTYEDFLPFSAAGIFQSNLATGTEHQHSPPAATSPSKQPGQVKLSISDVKALERAMGCKVLDADKLYAAAQAESLRKCEVALGLPEGSL